MSFVALDVETANPDMSSICQIGIVRFEGGKPVETWSSLVDPEDWFDDSNVAIHGIEEKDVRGAPNFKMLSEEGIVESIRSESRTGLPAPRNPALEPHLMRA